MSHENCNLCVNGKVYVPGRNGEPGKYAKCTGGSRRKPTSAEKRKGGK